MISRLLLAYSNTRPVKVISDNGRRYLERYFVCSAFGVRVYLHRFVGSDPDRGLHDHPWRWAMSFVLLGWYWEQTRQLEGQRRVRWFNFLTGDTFHRVLLPAQFDEVWTVFIVPARDVKEWGFLRDKGQLGQIFTPFNYGAGGKPSKWWKHAPKGREIRRLDSYIKTAERLPPEGEEVMCIDSGGHEQSLVRRGRLWWFPDGSMYVYFTPVAWKPLARSNYQRGANR